MLGAEELFSSRADHDMRKPHDQGCGQQGPQQSLRPRSWLSQAHRLPSTISNSQRDPADHEQDWDLVGHDVIDIVADNYQGAGKNFSEGYPTLARSQAISELHRRVSALPHPPSTHHRPLNRNIDYVVRIFLKHVPSHHHEPAQLPPPNQPLKVF